MACNRNHRYLDRLADLPDGQGGGQRHKCAGCAYDLGYSDGFNNAGRRQINWDDIEESQAGYGRHKDADEAYIMGFSDGAMDRRKGEQNYNPEFLG